MVKLIDDYGELRCSQCDTLICCNDCGDMPDMCPGCHEVIDYEERNIMSIEETEKELLERLSNERERCKRELRKVDLEIARLNGKREELLDRDTMLYDLCN